MNQRKFFSTVSPIPPRPRMHRFRSKSVIIRFQTVSVLILLKVLLVPSSLVILLYGIIINEREHIFLGAIVAGVTVILSVTQWVLAARTRCPLCLTPVLADKDCSKNRNAKTLFGSYRLRVALSILLKGSFRCPYCNEPSAMKVRDKR